DPPLCLFLCFRRPATVPGRVDRKADPYRDPARVHPVSFVRSLRGGFAVRLPVADVVSCSGTFTHRDVLRFDPSDVVLVHSRFPSRSAELGTRRRARPLGGCRWRRGCGGGDGPGGGGLGAAGLAAKVSPARLLGPNET